MVKVRWNLYDAEIHIMHYCFGSLRDENFTENWERRWIDKLDKIRNKEIGKRMVIQEVQEKIRRKLWWFGNINGTEQNANENCVGMANDRQIKDGKEDHKQWYQKKLRVEKNGEEWYTLPVEVVQNKQK